MIRLDMAYLPELTGEKEMSAFLWMFLPDGWENRGVVLFSHGRPVAVLKGGRLAWLDREGK